MIKAPLVNLHWEGSESSDEGTATYSVIGSEIVSMNLPSFKQAYEITNALNKVIQVGYREGIMDAGFVVNNALRKFQE